MLPVILCSQHFFALLLFAIFPFSSCSKKSNASLISDLLFLEKVRFTFLPAEIVTVSSCISGQNSMKILSDG